VKFGINFFPAYRPTQASAAEYFAQCLRVSERADALGYSSIKTVEHYFNDYGGSCPNPIVLLSAIAARTRRVRLVTGAVIPAFNHPIKLAGELAMLDNISGGRLDVGVGRAFVPAEYAAYGVDMAESRARFDEGTDAMLRLWTEDRVTYEGRFWHFENVHLAPRPYQSPHPPIWVAAVSSEESFVNAAKRGYNIMIVPFAGGFERCSKMVKVFRQVWNEYGHAPGTEQVQMSFHAYVAESRAEAVKGYLPAMRTYLDVFSESFGTADPLAQSGQYPGYDKMVEVLRTQRPEDYLENGYAFVGTPDDVVAQIRQVRDLFGEHEPSLQVTFGGLSDAEALRTVDLMASYVMPVFAN